MPNFMIGLGIGLLIAGQVLRMQPTTCEAVETAIVACEKELPRTQHCKMVAVPE